MRTRTLVSFMLWCVMTKNLDILSYNTVAVEFQLVQPLLLSRCIVLLWNNYLATGVTNDVRSHLISWARSSRFMSTFSLILVIIIDALLMHVIINLHPEQPSRPTTLPTPTTSLGPHTQPDQLEGDGDDWFTKQCYNQATTPRGENNASTVASSSSSQPPAPKTEQPPAERAINTSDAQESHRTPHTDRGCYPLFSLARCLMFM